MSARAMAWVLFFGAGAAGPAGATGPVQAQEAGRFDLAGYTITVEGDPGDFDLTVDTRSVAPGVEVATLVLASERPAVPGPLSLRWSLPSHDVRGQWTSGSRLNKSLGPDWYMSRVDSKLASEAPVFSLFGSDDGNRLTFAVSDALRRTVLGAGVREEDGRIHGRIDLLTEREPETDRIRVQVRFDRGPVPFHRALADVADWWASMPGLTPAPVPDAARRPMYSTWYSYHQSLDTLALLDEVERARELGFDAIIIDDGWQTLDSGRGYAYTGDWRPERIPGMRRFVDAVHDRGMKLLLWYAVPLVGERSETYARFEGRYLRYWDGQGAYELDPRYPEVRRHVIQTYRDAMTEWGVDGFKLDFLGRFVARDSTVLTARNGRDHASVNAATDRLMSDVMTELRALDPEVMIEFRQPYVGPAMRKYGNMFRAGDAPNAIVNHRTRVVDLRLLSGGTAVHSDMLMWHYEEPVEIAALQLLNVLFAVPQISVRLAEVGPAHLDMIRHWTAWWTRNRDVLLDGEFEARRPLANYPVVAAWGSSRGVVGLYDDMVVTLDAGRIADGVDVINGKATEAVVLSLDAPAGAFDYSVTDTRGRGADTGTVELVAGVHRFTVPPAGLLSLDRR